MTNFQAMAGQQGRVFEDACRTLLMAQGHHVSDKPLRVANLGIEIDAEVDTRGGSTVWAEFKGSWQGTRPGLQRTDTVKKALANAFLVATAPNGYPSFIILTSHLPAPGSSGDRMLAAAAAAGAVADVFNINDPNDVARLAAL